MPSISKVYLCGLVAACALALGPVSNAHAQQDERVAALLTEIRQLSDDALTASRAAEQAASVEELKRYADAVFTAIWGVPSGLVAEGASGEAAIHGWKERWQMTNAEFDSAFAARYGTLPPKASPADLGIMGRGRQARVLLEGDFVSEAATRLDAEAAQRIVVPLNNAIGWMKMDDGVTKGERQPRVDLTRKWDAPTEFWLSTADTGWLPEVYSQALNILKTDYDGDVQMARRHAAAMTQLIEKYLNGVDADADGSVEPIQMEGGLLTALRQAESAGLL